MKFALFLTLPFVSMATLYSEEGGILTPSYPSFLGDHLGGQVPEGKKTLCRKRRSMTFLHGTSISIKWSFVFPMKTVSHLKFSLQFTHKVKLSLEKLYPEVIAKENEERIDNILGDYLDTGVLSQLMSMSEGVVERIGDALEDQKYDFLQETDSENLTVVSNWIRGNESKGVDHMTDVVKSTILDLSQKLFKKKKFDNSLKKDRLKARQDRLYVYKDFESLFQKMGLPGRPCLLRTLCEIGQHPFDDSIFGELFNILMTASLGGRTEYPGEDLVYNDYIDAEIFGRNSGTCGEKYGQCPKSIFSFLHDLLEDML